MRQPTAETLVGREVELEQAARLVDGALAGLGALLLIGGEPGAGQEPAGGGDCSAGGHAAIDVFLALRRASQGVKARMSAASLDSCTSSAHA